jgi:hypothetical protein
LKDQEGEHVWSLPDFRGEGEENEDGRLRMEDGEEEKTRMENGG